MNAVALPPGATAPPRLSATPTAAVAAVDLAALLALADAFVFTWNTHDMTAFAALYAEDADFVNVYGRWWQGRQEIEQAHADTHQSLFRHSVLALAQPHSLRLITSDTALCRTHWTLTGIRDRNGEPAADRRGRLLHVMQRLATGWRIVATQNTDISPMP